MARRRLKRNTNLYKLIAAGVVFTMLVVYLIFFHFASSNETVPNLRGLNLSGARKIIAKTNFKLKASKSEFSKEYKKGYIISQKPAPKASTKKGTTIFIVLSKGAKKSLVKKITVPDIKNKSYLDANKILEKLGFIVTIKKSISPEKEKDIVIAQNPPPGTKVKKGLRITLIIGKGKDKVAVVDKTEDKKKTTNNSNSTVICIDPGHQTHANLSGEPVGPGSSTIKPKVSGGATGISTGVPEYKIALAVSLKLKSLLEERGYKVIMTRETNNVNISNSERAKIANKAKAALFVRIHADSSTSQSVNGYSVLYPAKNQWTENIYNKSIRAAQIVSDKLSATGAKNNGIVPRADITGFNWSKVPVILIESGFLSNPSEDRSLNKSSYQQKIAKSITSGIVSFLSK